MMFSLLAVGIGLRLWQYLANSSLWIDEAALSLNILGRSVAGLLEPLDYAQVAPVGFLLVQKGITYVAGTSEYALRAFPLICGLVSLLLFRAIAQQVLDGWAATFGVGLFALGIPFIYFSSQVKQYSSDIAAALLLLLLVLNLVRHGSPVMRRRRARQAAVAGALIAWFSQTALFVMVGLGAALALLAVTQRNRDFTRAVLLITGAWFLSALPASAFALSSVATSDREYFRWFWGEGFMPAPRSASDLFWLPNKIVWMFGAFGSGLGHTNGGLNYRWSLVFAAVTAYGFYTLARTHRRACLFLVLSIGAAILASAAAVYPFTARLLAFLVPFFLLATAAGAGRLLKQLSGALQVLSPVVLAVLGGAPIYALATAVPPAWVQHIRPVIEHVSERRQLEDKVYVYYGAALAFRYYAPRFQIPPAVVFYGRCTVDAPREYLRELDRFRGIERLWIVMTHEHRLGERELILGYLDQLGRRLDAVVIHGSTGRPIEDADGYLYDLSEPRSVSAETYPLPVMFRSSPQGMERWGCYGITGGETTTPGTR